MRVLSSAFIGPRRKHPYVSVRSVADWLGGTLFIWTILCLEASQRLARYAIMQRMSNTTLPYPTIRYHIHIQTNHTLLTMSNSVRLAKDIALAMPGR